MRRTRHVVLPVRSWQYIGLLIVSLACLTLGLVSRDREGHAGSLTGPELEHRAPHEVDACPNLDPFAEISSCPITKPEETTESINDYKAEIFRSKLSRSLSLDRSSRVRSPEIRERSSRNRDLETIERLSRSRTRVSDGDRSVDGFREARVSRMTRSQDMRSSIGSAARLSRSRDSSDRTDDRRSAAHRSLNFERRQTDRANYRYEDRQSRFAERREVNKIERLLNRRSVDRRSSLGSLQRYADNNRDRRSLLAERRSLNDRSVDQRSSLDLQRYADDRRERRSLPAERRVLSGINRQWYRSREALAERREFRDLARHLDHRSEIRERRSRSVERRESNTIGRRAIERRETERSSRREDRRNLLDRSTGIVVQRDIDRNNNNLNRRNRERSLENRRALLDRVANQERRSRFSVDFADSRKDPIESSERRSLSRSTERSNAEGFARETFSGRIGSINSNVERTSDRRSFSDRRSVVRRDVNRAADRRTESRVRDRKFLDRAASRISPENTRERIDRSRAHINRENTALRENYRITPARDARSRYNPEEVSSRERRERLALSSARSFDRNSANRRELSRARDSLDRRSRDLTPERRERTNRSYRSHGERRMTYLEKTRDSEKGFERRERERVLERRVPRERVLERSRGDVAARRAALNLARLDSRRPSERRVDESSRSREGSRMAVDRRDLERGLESRVIRERILEKRSARDSRAKSSGREIDEGLRLNGGSRARDRQARSSELRNLISMRAMARTTDSRTLVSRDRDLRLAERKSDERRDLRIRNLQERRAARSLENRFAKSVERESVGQMRQRVSNANVNDPSGLASLRRVSRISRVPEQNREQRELSAKRTLFGMRALDKHDRLSGKWGRNLQTGSRSRAEVGAKIVPSAMYYDELLKYPMTYDFVKQALIVALCTIYGLSLYKGKKSFIRNNVVQQMQRFMVW